MENTTVCIIEKRKESLKKITFTTRGIAQMDERRYLSFR
jgi:hypothetical protein